MWPSIIERAKQGGLNTIQTYVFWNVHELEQGKVIANSNRIIQHIKHKYIYKEL